MKTLTFFVACLATFILSSCGKSAKEGAQDSVQSDKVELTKETEESIKEGITVRFKALYQQVITRGDELPDLEKEFTSEAYYALYKAVQEPAEGAEIGYFDYDHWTQAQDSECPEPVIKEITVVDAKHAVLSFLLPYEEPSDITFEYVYERDNWYIDNINNEVEEMTEYIKELKASHQ